jgi:hypothetical protein
VSLWRRLEERFWTGPILRDYGTLADGRWGGGTRKVSALLAGKNGETRFFVRIAHKAFLSASLGFVELDRDAALKLKAALDDAVGRM